MGTTSICGVLMDTDTGEVLRSRTENSNAFLNGRSPWERIQDPEKIVSLAMQILEDLLSNAVVTIGVTGQMHGIVYTDMQGKAVSPLYTWQDGRGNQPFGGTTYAGYMRSHSGYGHVTHFYNTVNGLVHPRAVGFCTIHDYLVMRLCGLKKALIHDSDAASFGDCHLEKNAFAGNGALDVVSDFHVAGNYRGIPVSVAIGDNQASVFSCLTGTDGILLNIGTGSQISVLSDHVIDANGIESRPYFDGTYLVVGAALCGGRAYAVLKDFYARVLGYATEIEDARVYGIMEQMLHGIEHSSLTVDTRFSGSRADENLRGSIHGISTQNFTPEELTCGVLEGIINELHALYCTMGVQRRALAGSGNGLRMNPALCLAAERVFGATMHIPLHTEEAAYGAALFALVAAGYCRNAGEAQRLIRFKT